MLIRRDVIEKIGYLDELFFAYQEDADYCLRTRKAGWQVYYYPEAQITHFGGQGGSRYSPIALFGHGINLIIFTTGSILLLIISFCSTGCICCYGHEIALGAVEKRAIPIGIWRRSKTRLIRYSSCSSQRKFLRPF